MPVDGIQRRRDATTAVRDGAGVAVAVVHRDELVVTPVAPGLIVQRIGGRVLGTWNVSRAIPHRVVAAVVRLGQRVDETDGAIVDGGEHLRLVGDQFRSQREGETLRRAGGRHGPEDQARVPLSKERVLRAAFAYADEHGIKSLSMRDLGPRGAAAPPP